MVTPEERIPIDIELSQQEKELCNASFNEVILYYLVNPALFFTHFYNSISTMSWKFYF